MDYLDDFIYNFFNFSLINSIFDSNKETIVGSFFEDELVKFIPSDVFDIQVVKIRKKGKKKEYLIHYVGYPNSMNEWVSHSKLKKT